MGVNRGTARERTEKAVGNTLQVMGIGIERQVVDQGVDDPRDLRGAEEGRHAPQHQLRIRQRIDLKADPLPGLARLEQAAELVGLDTQYQRLEQVLRGRTALCRLRLELLIQHALMAGMHVHQHQSVLALGEDVDAVQLTESAAERLPGERRGCTNLGRSLVAQERRQRPRIARTGLQRQLR
jgi:hypothetical protein